MSSRNYHDADGNLLPYMLDDLIERLQAIRVEHGNLITWTEVTVAGYDDNETYSGPLSDVGVVQKGRVRHGRSYWQDNDSPVVLFYHF